MSAEHATARFRVTLTEPGDRLRLEALAQPNGEPVGARETRLPADLDVDGRARALQLAARRLDRAAGRPVRHPGLERSGTDLMGCRSDEPARSTLTWDF
ncbi:hypothetical protein BH23CHL10_BH23CHL10_12540 [soil metagenome]